MPDQRSWAIADFAAAYRGGARVTDIVGATLELLSGAPTGVLVDDPLVEQAMADAARLDSEATCARGPLHGVPFVVKDNIDVAGVPTTAGCPGFAVLADADATVVALLRAAGAVPVAKANLDQFATGLVGTRSPYGTPPNVLDPTLVPGGSSSGSAVAVALGLVPFALGTDTAGSGRVPAALNGIVGLKPTVGAASTAGIVPAVRRLDCPSVFARNVGDAAAVAAVIRAYDGGDPRSRHPVAPGSMPSPFVVGVPERWPPGVAISQDMDAWFAAAVERLTTIGCEVRPVDIAPMVELGAMLYGSALVGERTVIAGEAAAKPVEGVDPVVAAIVERGHLYSAVDAYRAEYEVDRRRSAATSAWSGVDVLALPTTPALATLAEVAADPHGPNEMLGQLTTFLNLLDAMAVVVPIGPAATTMSDGPVPAGLQLIGRAWHDRWVEALAAAFESGCPPAPVEQPCAVAVVGAHLAGLPLHHQLRDRRATLVGDATTAARYRLFALPDTEPPKPGLIRVADGEGAPIAVEVWTMGESEFGSFVAGVPAPLCIGTIELSDGTTTMGFLCEPSGLDGALDITSHGGWRAYLAAT